MKKYWKALGLRRLRHDDDGDLVVVAVDEPVEGHALRDGVSVMVFLQIIGVPGSVALFLR
jgi:hypothetical protein